MGASRRDEARRVLARRILERRKVASHPANMLARCEAFDERAGESFSFPLEDEGSGWFWQRDVLDWFHGCPRTIALKARQLGITWLACGYVLWTAVFHKPGSLCLVYRQRQDEAQDNLLRIWKLLHSLPAHLLPPGMVVLKPQRGADPTDEIRLRFRNGKTSTIVAMTSSSSSGHGRTAAVILLDEFSRIERADQIMTAISSAAGSDGRVIVISTANGRSNLETGEGNTFHHLWVNAEEKGFSKRFLSWSLHPDRDEEWYRSSPEVRSLKPHQRAEQYPSNEHEAFTLTNRVFFDPEVLQEYADRVALPVSRFDWEELGPRKVRSVEHDLGRVRLFRRPNPDHGYAIGADVATGRGVDYSAAFVVDLASMELVAEYHGKVDADVFARDLHYLGRWFNSAWIAVETGGGYGEPVIVALRDGRAGRPAYPKLYRHVLSSRPDLAEAKPFGFPMNSKTRPLVLNQFEKAVRERALPWVTNDLLFEMETFVYHDHGTSPRAAEGNHDDRVMATAIALEMFRLYGSHPSRRRHKLSRAATSPWVRQAA